MVLGNVAAHVVSKLDNSENFGKENNNNNNSYKLSQLLMLLISIGAIYIYWTCNSKINIGTLAKVFYAFFAWVFGIFYYLYYFIFRHNTCKIF